MDIENPQEPNDLLISIRDFKQKCQIICKSPFEKLQYSKETYGALYLFYLY